MPTDFSKCSVYRIDCDVNGKVYIGSTAQELHHRWADHKRSSRNPKKTNYKLYKSFADHGVDHHHISLVETISVESRTQLNAREGHWIRSLDTYKNGLNGLIAGRTMDEYHQTEKYKEYLQSEKHKTAQKTYNQTSEKCKTYQKDYKRTEKYKQQQKAYRERVKAAKANSTDLHIEQLHSDSPENS